MDGSQFEVTDPDSQSLDEVLLSDQAFSTDPSRVLVETSDSHRLRYRLAEWLAESPNRKVKSDRKKKVAETLQISIRQVERLLNHYLEDKLQEDGGVQRVDKGTYRVDKYWQDYISGVYEKSLKEKHPLKPADIVREVQRHALIDQKKEEGDYPHPATVYRILKPLIEQQRRKKKIRNPGSGSWLVVETRNGQSLRANFSNQIIQCDHTKLDIRIIGIDGITLQWRPWLTTVVDTFSGCLIGYHLWHKQPGAYEVGLALRNAILPKDYPTEYELKKEWNIYGPPLQYFFTDGGKDLSASKHIKALGKKLGFQCELRDRPNQGGIVERLFKTINTQFLEALPGYQPNRANKEQIEKAEKAACLTIDDLDKMLAGYFCDDYNHQPYPNDKRVTRYERWFIGMGNKLPDPLDERELDLCLMKEVHVTVQEHGTVRFKNFFYRCEELRSWEGKFVTLHYDPDHVLTMLVYSPDEEFIGHAHAINMDMQDLSLYELEQLNVERNKAERSHSNYDALLALDKRKNLVEERKQDKKQQQRSEQKKLREKGKKNSKVVELRKARKTKSSNAASLPELLPERIDYSQDKPAQAMQTSQVNKTSAIPEASEKRDINEGKRHRLIIPKDKKLKKIW
ncbi:Mu transposase C-terminal domain-containing protein [Nodosilinea sp. FACHB-13]|uniref:Mu transposase C-terminal domain-containing protein n=1 Tax=Cyanophyceae TaxID=3028117 RepID=UPI00168943CA|nr:Mu transposase C-terminal domain-containing protein [Nodosilinea sp. FACHB-13]MBD2110033.1 Mu transposase C-terminal domain-containing protein [Nodosilinea sp. FACHB-13]